MEANTISKAEVAAAVLDVNNLADWNPVRDKSTKIKLAEWRVTPPYTGPSEDTQNSEWVHHRNAILTIRLISASSRPIAPRLFRGYVTRLGEYIKYGVKYVVPTGSFQDEKCLHGFITNRVTEFIEHRDRYLTVGNRYNKKVRTETIASITE